MTHSASPNEPVNENPLDANVTPNQGGQSPEKTPEPRQPRPPSSAPDLSQSNTIGEAHAGKLNLANIIQEIGGIYFGDRSGFSNIVIRSFAFDEIKPLTKEKQEEIASLFVADPSEVERLRRVLVEKRILILSGESGLGKATTAIYLGSLIVEHTDAGEVEAVSPEIFLIPTLERYVKIDLNEICNCDDVPSNRFVIFKNALTRCNHDLLGFLAQLNEYSVGQFANRLKKDNSYLIFTVSPSEAAHLQPNLGDKDLHYELKHLSDELMAKGLERKLAQLAQSPRIASERLKQLREPKQQELLIADLKTMARIARFAEYYLRDSGATEVEADLGEAIRRSEDITYWFHHDLISDFEAWCFTLSLGLAHCLNDARGVSWVDFEYLRRTVWQCLKRDPELFPRGFISNGQPPVEFSEKPPALMDDIYLEKSRARILKDPNSLADLIHFSEGSYSQKLWEILLKHHRRILTLLLPRLCEMAEDHSGKYDHRQRALCARIIGRIGEIDPDRVSLALVERWLNSANFSDRATIGALYQGILASRDERYRGAFLNLLESLSASDNSNVNQGEEEETAFSPEEKNRLLAARAAEKNRLLTAISVYSQLGPYYLSLAVRGLERIAQAKLVPLMEDVQRIGRLIERTRNEFSQQTSADEALGLLIYQDMLSDLAARLYAQQGHIFVGVQYALCSLALNTDPISVFKELRYWIESSNQATGALVALMFLTGNGIAATLESRQVEISNSEVTTAERKSCNPMIAALTLGQESVLEMARFLVTLFESFSVKFIFPKEFIRYLRESFLFHLQAWVEESLPIESCRKATENLFAELMRVHKGVLFEPIYKLLNSPEFSKKDRDLKKVFVDAVLWQRH
jgi:hypothetical protein